MKQATLLWIPALPLIGAAFNLLFGRFLSRRTVHLVAVAAVAASFFYAAYLVGGPLWEAFKVWRGSKTEVMDGLYQQVYTWIEIGSFKVDLAFRMDTLSAVMVLVVTFVGYLGAWTHAATLGMPPWLAGLAGATVVTYFTFLPSFVFIFAGGPLVEATRGRQLFTAPLAAVTAAVVGVIANLALYFARHVFWPGGLANPPDWVTLAIAIGAAAALFWFRLGVIPVILACGVAGLVLRLMMPA